MYMYIEEWISYFGNVFVMIFIVFSRGMKNEVVGVFFVMRSIKIDSVNSMVSFSVIFFLELGLIQNFNRVRLDSMMEGMMMLYIQQMVCCWMCSVMVIFGNGFGQYVQYMLFWILYVWISFYLLFCMNLDRLMVFEWFSMFIWKLVQVQEFSFNLQIWLLNGKQVMFIRQELWNLMMGGQKIIFV